MNSARGGGVTGGDDSGERKTYETAAILMPPMDRWEPIQQIRERHDRHIRRWMPHINVLYPFVAPDRFDDVEPSLRRALARIEPFTIALTRFQSFSHGRGKYTMWLVPEPAEPLQQLAAALQDELPWLGDQFRFENGFTPHLSVGQIQGYAGVKTFLAKHRPRWKPIEFRVEELSLIWRNAPPDDVFRYERGVPLGAAAADGD